jgi:hypothetical protein
LSNYGDFTKLLALFFSTKSKKFGFFWVAKNHFFSIGEISPKKEIEN